MMKIIEDIYNFIGALICHQLPSRTLSIGGKLLPMCARDTGIYLGAFITAVFLYFKRRYGSDKPPELSYSLVLCIQMIPMLVDGISSYLGIRDSDNVLRLVTGIYFGSSILFFLVPAANFKLDFENKKPVLRCWKEIFIIAAVNAAVCFLILKTGFMPWILVSTCTIFSFVFLVSRVLYMVLCRCKFINAKYMGLYVAGSTIAVLIFMYLISISILQPARSIHLY